MGGGEGVNRFRRYRNSRGESVVKEVLRKGLAGGRGWGMMGPGDPYTRESKI